MKRLLLILLVGFLVLGGWGTASAKHNKLRVAAALIGPANDASWNAAAVAGLKMAQKRYGIEFTFVESVKLADLEGVYRDFAAKGYGLIIGHAFNFGDAALKAAKDYPKAKFAITASSASNGTNVAGFDFRQQETAFVAGVLAGLMTKSNRLGAIGGFGFPAIIRQVEGFRLGARYANPKIRMFHTYINSWVDVGKAKETALGQLDLGADIVFTALDEAGHGAIKAAEEKGKFAIPSYSPQHQLAPKTVLTSVLHGVPFVILNMVKEVHDGTFQGKVYKLGFQRGVGGLPPWHPEAKANIPQGIRDRVDRVSAAIKSGKLVIPEIVKDGGAKKYDVSKLPVIK
ncbi:MAG: BMP family protein [Nitrospinota bacterium]